MGLFLGSVTRITQLTPCPSSCHHFGRGECLEVAAHNCFPHVNLFLVEWIVAATLDFLVVPRRRWGPEPVGIGREGPRARRRHPEFSYLTEEIWTVLMAGGGWQLAVSSVILEGRSYISLSMKVQMRVPSNDHMKPLAPPSDIAH